MSPLSKNFVRASLIYFFIAAILGVLMIFMKGYPAQLLFAHVHLNLLGWMSMIIFGVGYHILPRFSGTPLAYPKVGNLQFYIANIGLVGLVSFRPIHPVAEIFASLQVISVGFFWFYIWVSMIPPKPETE